MKLFKKKKILVTHDGTFHADDIFACATLSIYLKDNVKIIRTRDKNIIEKGDYVFDVGGMYDPDKNLFDHHQEGGAGKRENGIPYASFGLVWEKYGEMLCKSKEVANIFEDRLVIPIDANDSGVSLYDIKGDFSPYTIQDVFFAFRPSVNEEQNHDKIFLDMVSLAKKIIIREIKKIEDTLFFRDKLVSIYQNTLDKRIIVLDQNYPWGEVLGSYEEPLYVVSPKNNMWRVECVRKDKYSFENKKSLPEAWAGKKDDDLVKITGVKDAVFCHNGRFLVVSKTKEGAIKLAEIALEN